MNIKANLHFHTSDDPHDKISYSFYKGIDEAVKSGFKAIALTLHDKFGYTEEYKKYAEEKGIVLIPGIERSVLGKHVVILNCDMGSEKIDTFEKLREYKKMHPEIFVLAPHPYYGHGISLGEHLDNNIELFDGIEWSWFYSPINLGPNELARKTSQKNNLPFIATSDTHFLVYLNTGSCELDCESFSVASVISSLRNKKFTNISKQQTVFGIFGAYVRYFLLRIKNRDF
jgi:hypothetical protein